MLPTNSVDNSANAVWKNAKIFSNTLLRFPSFGPLSDFSDSCLRQESKRMFFSLIASSLLCHISHVVGMCSKKQMIGINTRRVVARMQNALSLRKNLIVSQFPHEVMGKNNSFTVPNSSVPSLIFASWPEPTVVCHRNIVPYCLEVVKCR
jgi:hypothetical protein